MAAVVLFAGLWGAMAGSAFAAAFGWSAFFDGTVGPPTALVLVVGGLTGVLGTGFVTLCLHPLFQSPRAFFTFVGTALASGAGSAFVL